MSIAGTGANQGPINGLPVVPASDSSDTNPFGGIGKLASRAGNVLNSVLGRNTGANGLLDALTGVDPDIMAKLDNATQRYTVATKLLEDAKKKRDASGANAAPDASALTEEEFRFVEGEAQAAKAEMLALEASEAQSRVARVKGALSQQFKVGARLPSIAQLGVDPATYKPQSKEAAAAFTERLTIDMVTGVAELDALQAEWQKVNATAPGSAQLQSIEQAYKQKYAWVEKLISAYESQTGEKVEGTVLAGNKAQDIAGLRQAGDEAEETGVSKTAGKLSGAMMDSFVARFFKIQSDAKHRMEEQDRRHAEEMKRMDENGAERRKADREAQERGLVRSRERQRAR